MSAFVGRERELEQLVAGLEDAFAGRGRLFLLSGEPGIGKSRLADELTNRAAEQGAQVLVGRCWEAGGAPPFWPWVQALRMLVREGDRETLRSRLGAGGPDLAHLLPELRERLPDLPEPPTLESESARFRLFDTVSSFLRAAAQAQPIVLILDDLHAADEPSLLLLRFVAGELGSSRLLIVALYRDVDPTVSDPLAEALAELARGPVTRRLSLAGLGEAEVARFIELSTAHVPGSGLVHTVHAETEGNPLFVGEIVRLLAGEGRLDESGPQLAIPQSVKEVIGRRLLHLPDECRDVLTVASVIGREFDLEVLARIGDFAREPLLEVLAGAAAERVVTDVPATASRLRFSHVLIRDTLYEGLKQTRRTELHRQVVEALEALSGDERGPHLAELAHHAIAGGDLGRGLSYARQAGGRALALLAYEEASRLYEQALHVLDLSDSDDERARGELLLDLGEAQARAGDETAASATFLTAAELARSAQLTEQLARAALGYGGRFVWMVEGFDEHVMPLLEQALDALGEKDSSLRVRVLARLSGALRDQPQPERRDQLSGEAVEMARRLGDSSALAYALDGRYSAIWGPENVEERMPIVDEIISRADEVGDKERAFQGRFYKAIALLELGETPAVYKELGAMNRLADELRQPAQRWYVDVLRTILALFEGRFEEARTLISETSAQAPERGGRPVGAYRQTFLLHREQGRLSEVVEQTERAVEEMPTIDVLRCFVADLYCELGREAEAREIFDSFAETDFDVRVDNDKLFGWCLLAEVCWSLGDPTHASRLYELVLPHADRNAVTHPICAAGSVSRYLGLLASTLSRWDDAERHFDAAVEMNERMGARPWVAHTQHDYARMLLARGTEGDGERAGELLGWALATASELGMEPLAANASALLDELRNAAETFAGYRIEGEVLPRPSPATGSRAR